MYSSRLKSMPSIDWLTTSLSRWRTGAGTAAGSGEALAGESSEGEASEGEGEDAVLFFSNM